MRGRSTPRLAVGGVVLAILGVGAEANAHLGHVILRAERYLKLDASDRDTRLVVSLTLGTEEASRVLTAADADGDHTVSATEADAYLAQWGQGLTTDLPIEIDGAPHLATWTDGYMEPLGSTSASALTVEMTTHLPVIGPEHVVSFRDQMRREVFERTDVAFRAHDGAELVVAGPGEQPSDVTRDLSFGAGERDAPSIFTTRLRFPSHEEPFQLVRWALGGFVVVGLGLLGALVRRRRSRA